MLIGKALMQITKLWRRRGGNIGTLYRNYFHPKEVMHQTLTGQKLRKKKEILNTFSEEDDNDDENTEDLMAYDDDVNELVKRFRYLHETDSTANRREIMRILKELERLGVIEFH